MSPLASLAESKIQEAIESGEFQELAGKGQPLDMDAYFAVPSSLRSGFGLLKSAGVTPPEVEAMRTVAYLRERIERAASASEKAALRAELMSRETELVIGLERMKRSIKMDAAM